MRRASRWLVCFALPPVLLLVLVVVAWDAAIRLWDIQPFVLPRPGAVLETALAHRRDLLEASITTGAAALCGFGLSLLFGLLIGIVFSQSRIIQRSIYPYAIFLQTMPIVAVAPLIIRWFDAGFRSVVIVSSIVSLFPIITSATAGLTAIDANLRDLFRIYNASRWQLLVKLRLPGSVPYLVTGARISCGLSVIGAIVGEMFAGFQTERAGLGYLITMTNALLKTDYTLAALVCSTLLGLIIFASVTLLGSTILNRWYAPGSAGAGEMGGK